MAGLQKTADAYAAVDLAEIAKLEADIAGLIARKPDAAAILADQWSADLVYDFAVVAEYVRARHTLALILKHQGRQPARLNEIARVATVLGSCAVGAAELGPVTSFSRERLEALDAAIREIEDMKVAVFGYLFVGKKLLSVSRSLHDKCKIECEKPHRDLPKLKALSNNLHEILDHLAAEHLEDEFGTAILLIAAELAGAGRPVLVPPEVVAAARRLEDAMSLGTPLLSPGRDQFYAAMLAGTEGPLSLVCEMGASEITRGANQSPFRGRAESRLRRNEGQDRKPQYAGAGRTYRREIHRILRHQEERRARARKDNPGKEAFPDRQVRRHPACVPLHHCRPARLRRIHPAGARDIRSRDHRRSVAGLHRTSIAGDHQGQEGACSRRSEPVRKREDVECLAGGQRRLHAGSHQVLHRGLCRCQRCGADEDRPVQHQKQRARLHRADLQFRHTA